ncbi:prepilin-type N-terminal cleavage/methylation domain-containing protein [Patescibacteria group bacterium]
MKHRNLKAFTLVEMLLVVAIIGIIATGAIMTSQGFRNQIVFSSNYQNIEGFCAEARNKSLTGESFIDTGDYDGDGSFDDLILPNGYIVNFKTVDDVTTVSLYADLFDSTVGEFDVDDFFLKSYELDDSVKISVLSERKTSGSAIIDETDFSIIYTTPGADFELINEPNTSLEIKIYQVDNQDEEIRAKYLFMHYLFGIPEILNESYLYEAPPSLTL